MRNFIILSYSATLFFYACAFALRLTGLKRAEHAAGFLAVVVNAACLTFLTVSGGNLPVFELFESFLLASFVLGLLGLFLAEPEGRIPDTRTWVWLEILLLLFITLFAEKSASSPVYDHNDLYIVLFHGLRIITLSVMLFSSAIFIQARLDQKGGKFVNERAHEARNFLVLGAVLFLAAEYIGILWCQNGWGDFWHWSPGFFQSTLIVLYLMLVFHVPGKNARSEAIRTLLGGLSGFFVLGMMLIRSVL
jgi:ABC-type transport system involved in cytochrome c biogenesis permease subunit